MTFQFKQWISELLNLKLARKTLKLIMRKKIYLNNMKINIKNQENNSEQFSF